jgi:flagellar protein FliS
VNTAIAYQKYKEQEVTTANPVGLVVMLYNGCIKRLRQAQLSMDKKDYAETNAHLKRAQDILAELVNGLDFRYPVANDLLALYEFMIREIVKVNLAKDRNGIDPLVDMLSDLRDAWVQVGKTCGNVYEEEEGTDR